MTTEVDKITNAPTQNELIDKVNEVIDNLGGGGSTGVFIAEYGTTSYADVLSAYNAGKEIVCLWKMWNRQSSTMSIVDNVFNFHFPLQNNNFRLTLNSSNTWNTNSITLQSTNNMVTSIDSSSTNSTYPTSKAVYDVLPKATSDITNDSGFITGITSSDVTTALGYTPYNSSNPNGYTSNIGTVTSVNNIQPDANGNITLSIPDTSTFEKVSNKVTSISSSSTDTQYPSAKCVYDNLVSKVNTSSLVQARVIIQTYSSGTSWYRIWSDGWCEQGGNVFVSGSGASTSTITYLKTFANVDYFVDSNFVASSDNMYGQCYNLTTTGCTIKIYKGRDHRWYACGYLASGEF